MNWAKQAPKCRASMFKVVCFSIWFAEHNNLRYASLFPKLSDTVKFYKLTLSRQRFIRAVQFRLWQLLKRRIYPLVLRNLCRQYKTLFTVDMHQITAWPYENSVVVDVDDPCYTETEVRLLNSPQVKAIIVTTEKMKAVFQEMGVSKPIYVIPQGIDFDRINLDQRRYIRERFSKPDEVVVGYHAPSLTLSSDGSRRARQGMDDLDFLLATMEKAREIEPRLTLWLIGKPSEGVKAYAADRPYIKLFGYVPFWDVLNFVASFDIGVYPRILKDFPPGRFSVKIAQMMGCGVPIVSTSADEAFIINEAGCGIVCNSQEEFKEALVLLAHSPEKRRKLGEAGRAYAKVHLDWNSLVKYYKEILLE